MLAGLLQGIRSFSPFPPLQQSEEVGSPGLSVALFLVGGGRAGAPPGTLLKLESC
jgi:hypothetical protein